MPINDSTVARIAGNILSGYQFTHKTNQDDSQAIAQAVEMARAIVAEVERTTSPVSVEGGR